MRSQRGGEIREVEEDRGKLLIDQGVGPRREQPTILPQDELDLLELGAADPRDPLI